MNKVLRCKCISVKELVTDQLQPAGVALNIKLLSGVSHTAGYPLSTS